MFARIIIDDATLVSHLKTSISCVITATFIE